MEVITMKKTFYLLTMLTICLCFAACQKKDSNKTDPAQTKESATVTTAPDTSDSEDTADTNETTPEAEATATATATATPDASPTPETAKEVNGSASGTLIGFVDAHTIEVLLGNGEAISYQIQDESLLRDVETKDINGDTQISFDYTITTEGAYILTALH